MSGTTASGRSGPLQTIVRFLVDIGIPVREATIERDTVLPGIDIERGTLVYDPQRLLYPGDLLHEAGHLAVASPRQRASAHGAVALDAGAEMAAIAWSWAAREHLGLDPRVVFHPGGYQGGAESIIENFAAGRYFGVPLLQVYGIAAEEARAQELGMPAFPRVARWLRGEDEAPAAPARAPVDRYPPVARLPLTFDAHALVADLAGLSDSDWAEHFNHRDYSGRWRVASLRAPSNARHPIQAAFSDPTVRCWKDTPLMARCPAMAAAVASLRCPANSVRLLGLSPGSTIHEHRDHPLSLTDGIVRLHLPVVTSPGVEFLLAGQRVDMRASELWYLDFNQPHSVHNGGDAERVHLVMDCAANDWLRKMVRAV